ncbi:MAG: alpha/beta fold hydrolase [Proteobacteria bacterium]|uniref:YheT family hydrolase n=1 Tax=Rudaea sp. TaxID=2136325 RepID=UPI001D248C24|nr:alpha/beta fold hydrolase [Pseudomonadota bacterium]MBS0568841.1 alpha/beta fold hydrolase [Pseudomonadota bacterium]
MNAPTREFHPRRWLRNPHVQSVLASSGVRRLFFRHRRVLVDGAATEHVLDCGDGVRLQGFHTRQTVRPQPRALVVLLHGWEGSVQSTYVLNTGARLLAEGCDVFRLNFRDHGDTHHLNRDIFHSCRIEEVVGALAAIAATLSQRPLVLGGYSLGGNFALRAALRARQAGVELAWVFAVCPPISPSVAMRAIESSPVYSYYFLRKWRSSLKRKQALFPQVQLFAASELRGNLRELTQSLVSRHTDFGTVENYFNGYSIAGDTLSALAVPATILTAADDPIIPVADFHALKLSASTERVIVPHGGHCGFIRDASLSSWAEDFLAERLNAHLGNRP